MMKQDEFRKFWSNKTKGLSKSEKRKLKIKWLNHSAWCAHYFTRTKNPPWQGGIVKRSID